MTDKKIESHLADAIKNTTPDMLGGILLRVEELGAYKKGNEKRMTDLDKKTADKRPGRRSTWVKWAASAAAAVGVFMGVYFGYGHFAVDAIIDLDVNPSIEIKVNRAEKVLSASPLNAEAEMVLGDMQLKNVDLDIAINAVIGSMLKNGYVDEIKNSILISVESSDANKGQDLEQRLSQDVASILDASAVGGAVLSQTVTQDDRLKALAQEHNISLGKAALVDMVVSQDARLKFADIAKLAINDINLLLSGKQADLQNVTSHGQASSGAYIGEEAAKSAALGHAQLDPAAVTFVKVRLDYDDGRMVYEVDFNTADAEYEYEIDAVSGTIIGYDREGEGRSMPTTSTTPAGPAAPTSTPAPTSSGNNTSQGNTPTKTPAPTTSGEGITQDKAKAIALSHAGFAQGDVTNLTVKADWDDGRSVYDVEFNKGNIEYDYEIDAGTGAIREWDSDYDD